jgi:hypothetical protein
LYFDCLRNLFKLEGKTYDFCYRLLWLCPLSPVSLHTQALSATGTKRGERLREKERLGSDMIAGGCGWWGLEQKKTTAKRRRIKNELFRFLNTTTILYVQGQKFI